MNCSSCNSKIKSKFQDYLCESKVIGVVVVPLVEIGECPDCAAVSLSTSAANEVGEHVSQLEERAIGSLPGNDLITAGQAATILGVTKQAFSKNPKIKKGLVYFRTIGTKRYYFKNSVELFKAAGDGRFPLTKWISSVPEECLSQFHDCGQWLKETVCPADETYCSVNSWEITSTG